MLVPLIVRPNPIGSGYEIVAGHRRKAASEWAGIDTVPVMIMQFANLYIFRLYIVVENPTYTLFTCLLHLFVLLLFNKEGFVEILEFTHFARIFKFNRTPEIGKKKEISHEIKVSVVMHSPSQPFLGGSTTMTSARIPSFEYSSGKTSSTFPT